MKVNITTDTSLTVDFALSITVAGYVEVLQTSTGPVLRVTPISAKVSEQKHIMEQLKAAIPKSGIHAKDCVELEKLILYIINVVLASRIGSFVKEFPLPLPLRLTVGAQLGDIKIEIVDDLLVAYGRIDPTVALAKSVEQTLPRSATPEMMKALAIDVKNTGSDHVYVVKEGHTKADVSVSTASTWPKRGLFIIFKERAFQVLASALLRIDERDEHSTSVLVFNVRYGWFVKVFDPVVKVATGGLGITAKFDGGGWVNVSMHTHCGDPSIGVTITADAQPKIQTVFSFKGRDLWMSAAPGLFPINWHFDLPWPFNQIASWLFDALSDVAILILNLIGFKWKQQLTTIPNQVPGTTIKFNPVFDANIVQMPNQPALMILADVNFSA